MIAYKMTQRNKWEYTKKNVHADKKSRRNNRIFNTKLSEFMNALNAIEPNSIKIPPHTHTDANLFTTPPTYIVYK